MTNDKGTPMSQQRIRQRGTGETVPQLSRSTAPLKIAGPQGHGPLDSAKERRRTPDIRLSQGRF
jgi:hypothetical protein